MRPSGRTRGAPPACKQWEGASIGGVDCCDRSMIVGGDLRVTMSLQYFRAVLSDRVHVRGDPRPDGGRSVRRRPLATLTARAPSRLVTVHGSAWVWVVGTWGHASPRAAGGLTCPACRRCAQTSRRLTRTRCGPCPGDDPGSDGIGGQCGGCTLAGRRDRRPHHECARRGRTGSPHHARTRGRRRRRRRSGHLERLQRRTQHPTACRLACPGGFRTSRQRRPARPSGRGKTQLATALGVIATRHGHRSCSRPPPTASPASPTTTGSRKFHTNLPSTDVTD